MLLLQARRISRRTHALALADDTMRPQHVPFLLLPLLLLLLIASLLPVVRAGAPPGPESVFNDAGFLSVDKTRGRNVSLAWRVLNQD